MELGTSRAFPPCACHLMDPEVRTSPSHLASHTPGFLDDAQPLDPRTEDPSAARRPQGGGGEVSVKHRRPWASDAD
eukprot:8251874-Pyramimonas_sp.AAC.1